MGRGAVSESTIRAAGGVLWRATTDADGAPAVEVAVIHRPRYDDWSLPKGKLASGEREVDGAIREVMEETGYHVRLGRSLGETRYLKVQEGYARPKVVRWWAMEAAAGVFDATREVDALQWLTLGEAHDILTRDTDREVLERFVRGTVTGRMVLLVRHARAVARNEWQEDDALRPLDECGWAQADDLVRLLAHFDPTIVASPDLLRCQQTVEPLAASLGLEVRSEALLSAEGYLGDEPEAVTLARSLGGEDDRVVLCSQGEVIPDLLFRLAVEDDVDLPQPAATRKGSVWALEFQGTRVVAAEYFPPPEPPECARPSAHP
jgi:8-oxo-(d)GTP phosphatase